MTVLLVQICAAGEWDELEKNFRLEPAAIEKAQANAEQGDLHFGPHHFRPSDFDFEPRPSDAYMQRSSLLFEKFCGLHPLARRLNFTNIQEECAPRKVADLCLVTELTKNFKASLAASYPSGARRKMQLSPALVSSDMLVPANFSARSHHASTLVEVAPRELLAAWFGGSWEGEDDTAIFMTRYKDGAWSRPWEVVPQDNRSPLWNPVLLHVPRSGQTLLFYKEGADPLLWTGKVIRSSDGGHTWSPPEALPEGILGPAKNKPIILADGTILSPSSEELGPVQHTNMGETPTWSVHMEASRDGGQTWTRSSVVPFDGNIIQPTLFVDGGGNVRMLARMSAEYVRTVEFDEEWHYPKHYRMNNSMVVLGVSDSSGFQYSRVERTVLPCPNSGIDSVRLQDGRLLLVYNPTNYGYRAVLGIAVSEDDGESWYDAMLLERFTKADMVRKLWTRYPEYSYPAVIQAEDGMVHITYTYSISPLKKLKCGRENIKHVVVNPLKLEPIKLPREEIPAAKLYHFVAAMQATHSYTPNLYKGWLKGNNGMETIGFDKDYEPAPSISP
eukprot:CAMPEP_0117693912 /NCGR_PEP_ID=MMETSP0804-20121206/27153_1 /TAXON_ID=1074897 /ORGANISM="Tetraselmis astigmatica, Strain CCMP880" /LENGTH=557 /DNA_ID=CAMNT_0005507537 /DNA_START=188 /DNA_END=1861 /DNA_ORIENTATION=-